MQNISNRKNCSTPPLHNHDSRRRLWNHDELTSAALPARSQTDKRFQAYCCTRLTAICCTGGGGGTGCTLLVIGLELPSPLFAATGVGAFGTGTAGGFGAVTGIALGARFFDARSYSS